MILPIEQKTIKLRRILMYSIHKKSKKNKIYFGIIVLLGILVRIFFILKVPCKPI